MISFKFCLEVFLGGGASHEGLLVSSLRDNFLSCAGTKYYLRKFGKGDRKGKG